MLQSIAQIEDLLERGAVSVPEILSLRRRLHVPFKFHPLGFIVCTLLVEDTRRLRLHYWPAVGSAQQSPECQIHDHLFEFRSWILEGTVENIVYVQSPEGVEHTVYEAKYAGDQSILTKTAAMLLLAVQNRSAYTAGSCYAVGAGVLHETVRLGQIPAFTVLVTNDVSVASPLVLGPMNGEQKYVYHREVVPEAVVSKLLPAA